jgi:hypothetical protein
MPVLHRCYSSDAYEKDIVRLKWCSVCSSRGGASLVHGVQMMKKLRKLVYEWVQKNQTKTLKATTILVKGSQSNQSLEQNPRFYTFRTKLGELIWIPSPTALEVFQINLGKMCNQFVALHARCRCGPGRDQWPKRPEKILKF